ncbi:MAG: polyphosphate kinase 1, partial [Gammaproteobacteria bacterium]
MELVNQPFVKAPPQPPADLSEPQFYLNRELSLLAFNQRVLELAEDISVPLLERLRFLCISTSNLDEFFEIRVGVLKQQIALNIPQPGPDGLSPQEQLRRIGEDAHRLVARQYDVLNDVLLPALEEKNIRFVRRTHWNREQAEWVREYFVSKVLPVLTPLGLDPAHPFPRVLNKSLNFIVTLEGKDPFWRDSSQAIVQAPRSLPRLIRMPEKLARGPDDFVFLSSMIHAHVAELFPGMTITGSYQFRATRNSDLFVSEEDIDDLLSALKGELPTRHYGQAVRLEITDTAPQQNVDFLLQEFELDTADVYRVNGPVNLHRM